MTEYADEAAYLFGVGLTALEGGTDMGCSNLDNFDEVSGGESFYVTVEISVSDGFDKGCSYYCAHTSYLSVR